MLGLTSYDNAQVSQQNRQLVKIILSLLPCAFDFCAEWLPPSHIPKIY